MATENEARAGDGAEILDQLVPVHTDAVIGNRDAALALGGGKPDLEIGAGLHQAGFGLRQIAQLVAGIGGVGDQFSQKYLFVAVQRMDDDIEYLADFRLEFELVLGHNFLAH